MLSLAVPLPWSVKVTLQPDAGALGDHALMLIVGVTVNPVVVTGNVPELLWETV